MGDELREYRRKRDLDRSGEPAGGTRGRHDPPLFVVQQHDASSMHWDLRIEADGVLHSWAIPKGPSTDPREKRLAVQTEPHPLDYADFEGHIPEDTYGAGNVIVWDIGPYRNLTENGDGDQIPAATAIEDGHLKFWVEGDKLRGAFALTRTKMRGDPANWILIKLDDEGADARRNPVSSQPESVVSGRSVDEVDEDG
jgi:DNA ligase D-like protein (predicted 3'-phosphoesterase)